VKIKPEHVAIMHHAISPLDTPERRQHYRTAGHTARRYRWDLLYLSGLTPWLGTTIYRYACDDHIDTALRTICGHIPSQRNP